MNGVRQGCYTEWGGRLYDDACDECGHALVAHRVTDRVCSICDAVDPKPLADDRTAS